MKKKENLNTTLQKIITDCYQKGCDYLGIIPYKKATFKGFYEKKLFQKVYDNEEILMNLEINNSLRKKFFWAELQKLEAETAGITWPLNRESWIMFNPVSWKTKSSEKLKDDLAEDVAHETAHAVIFNTDINRGHEYPHKELTKFLKYYLISKHNLKELLWQE